MKRQQAENISRLLESQYEQFREDINDDGQKGKGGLAFITDERKDLLAIQGITKANEHNKVLVHNSGSNNNNSKEKKKKSENPEDLILGG